MTRKTLHHKRNAVGVLLLLSLAILVITYWQSRNPEETAPVRTPEFRPLPADVEGTVTGYIFRDLREGCNIEVRGQRVTRRGKKVLGLRTNLLKTNYFEKVAGEIRSRSRIVSFSADNGEGTMAGDSPLVLKGNVFVRMNGKNIPNIQVVHMYLQSGRMKIITDRIRVYRFN